MTSFHRRIGSSILFSAIKSWTLRNERSIATNITKGPSHNEQADQWCHFKTMDNHLQRMIIHKAHLSGFSKLLLIPTQEWEVIVSPRHWYHQTWRITLVFQMMSLIFLMRWLLTFLSLVILQSVKSANKCFFIYIMKAKNCWDSRS